MESKMQLDKIDRLLLEVMQQGFLLVPNPWEMLGRQLGISGEEVLNRVRMMKSAGLIRRIGAVLDSQKMNFVSELCAMALPEEKIPEIAAEINRCSGVTHNYQREGTYNLWFTLTTTSEAARDRQLMLWEHQLGYPILRFPSEKFYKRRVHFPMKQAGDEK